MTIRQETPKAGPVTAVKDGLAPVTFNGYLLAEVTNERPTGPRWLDLYLYREVDDDGTPGAYIVHSVGVSLVYHRGADTNTCRAKGVPVTAGAEEVPEDAEPCRDCRPAPLSRLGPEDVIRMESNRHTAHRCITPGEVIEALRDGPGRAPGRLSGPAQRLLQVAASRDPEIREAATTPVRL